MDLKRGIEKAVEAVVAELKRLNKPTKDQQEIDQVGTISANNDQTIGKIIAEAIGRSEKKRHHDRRGEEHGNNPGRRRGHEVRQGLSLTLLRHKPRQDGDSPRRAFILIIEKKIGGMKDIMPVLKRLQKQERPS